MRIPLFIQAIVIGLAVSVALTALIVSFSPALVAALWGQPGMTVALLLAFVLPSDWIRAIEPEGGVAAFVLLVGVGTLLAW